ncbi:MAG: cellulase family glycosylhydrolase, partial [Myxococcota bacterium]|nr:cellulase family glycosylhydrolase [Myxococcota bacterium]
MSRAFCLLFFLPACAATDQPSSVDSGAPDVPTARLSVEQGRLIDSSGRTVLLRGVNARVEGLFDVTFDDGRAALEEIPPFTGQDCAFLAEELGLNLLRLPVNWSGIEPEPDDWDAAYLSHIGRLVDDCDDAGVLTIVDLHQDAYGKDIGEDGAPLWAIEPPPPALLEGPLTSEELAARRISPAVIAAFRSLYSNAPLSSTGEGAMDAYAEMAGHLAAFLRDHPGAVALELQNEPVPLGDQAGLDAFHDAVTTAVRAAHPTLPVVFEPDAIRNITDAAPVEAPFPFDNAIYGPHIYTDVFEDGWASEDVGAIRDSVAAADQEARDHGAHLFIGEFGNDPRTERGALYIDTCLAAFDQYQASWAVWLYEEHSQGSWGLWDEGSVAHTRGALQPAIRTPQNGSQNRTQDAKAASQRLLGDEGLQS